MKKTKGLKAILTLAVVSSFMLGCSKWNQDPLADRPDVLNDSQGKPTKPDNPAPIASDAIRIDTVEFYSFEEGREDKFEIGARVLIEGYVPEIRIENQDDFPGARFDAAKGEFTWTPARGTVTSGGSTKDIGLRVRVVAKKAGLPVLSSTKQVRLLVSRKFMEPEIVSVAQSNSVIREGGWDRVTVRVRDMDAGAAQNTWPTLVFGNVTGKDNLINFIVVQAPTNVSANVYDFPVLIDLRGAELTTSISRAGFSVQAISQFQKAGVARAVSMDVLTSFAKPVSTWTKVLEGPAGTAFDYQFLIMDPTNTLNVTAGVVQNLPAGATVNCSLVSVSVVGCDFKWRTTPQTVVNSYNFQVNTVTRNTDASDRQEERLALPFAVRVTPATTTTTTVTTTTTLLKSGKSGGRP